MQLCRQLAKYMPSKTGDIDMSNDNLTAETPHHAECLRLIQDLHDLFRCAEKAGYTFANATEDTKFAYDWKYWADECAGVLGVKK